MTTPPLQLSRIGQIAMPVQDVERATKFWRDVLGVHFLFAAPGLAFFDCGGIRVMLSPPEPKGQNPSGSILYFRVDDIAAAHAALVAKHVHFEEVPRLIHRAADHDLWIGAFRDSEGNLLALMSEVRPQPTR